MVDDGLTAVPLHLVPHGVVRGFCGRHGTPLTSQAATARAIGQTDGA